jgi:hypothetical protein
VGSGVFNIDLSTGLSYIVFFYNCKNFDFQEWKEILLGNIDVINKSYYFWTVFNLIQHNKAKFSSCRQSEQWGKSMVLMIK